MDGLLARIWSTSVESAVMIVAVGRLFHTSFVPSIIITTSGWEMASQPGSWLSATIPVALKPPWPSCSPSKVIPQPPAGLGTNEKSVFV